MLEVKNLSFKFPNKFQALKKINLKIFKNEFIVLTGINGSGKSVLTYHLNGLLEPTEGEVLFENVPIKNDLLKIRQKVGIVFQDPDMQIVGQTVYDDIAFGLENLRFKRDKIHDLVKESLSIVGLTGYEQRLTNELSGGEKRRLVIAGILCMQPELIIFDEPFNGLDYLGVKQVIHELIKLHKAGRTVFVITHDIEKILAHATRFIIMKNGEIVFDEYLKDKEKPLSNSLKIFDIRISETKIIDMSW